MKIILLQEVKGKGVEGDVIDVADGFANNYLLPQKMAVKATAGNLKQLEQRRHIIEKREADRTAAAAEMKSKLDGLRLTIDARVGEGGQLFGSVTSQMIVDALREQAGIEVDRRLVEVHKAIKTVGEHHAVVSLHGDAKADLVLLVGDAEAIVEETAEEAAAEQQSATEAAEESTEAEVSGEDSADADESAE